MSDMNCPYCDAEQEVCHDDGFGYSEDERHEHECSDCEKIFIFITSISFDYESYTADCLNGKDHNLKMSSTHPREYSNMCCEDCDYHRNPTESEFSDAGIIIEKNK